MRNLSHNIAPIKDTKDRHRAHRAQGEAREMYGKCMSVSKKYRAHAEAAYNEGDLVEITEGRPISKTKAWTVTKLIQSVSAKFRV